MWSFFSLDACNLLNLETAAGLSDSCGIRAVSATKLQNLIWTRYSVLKTTTKHNQTILDNLNLSKHLSFIFFSFFFFYWINWSDEVYFVSYYFIFLTILFLILQITQSAGGEHTQELLFCLFLLNNPFSDPLDHTKCRRRAYSRIINFFFSDVRNKVS